MFFLRNFTPITFYSNSSFFKSMSIMFCARKVCVYAFAISIFICTQSIAVAAFPRGSKEDKPLNSSNSASSNSASVEATDEFQWKEHQKLSWEDFRGSVNAVSDESAAATHCGIGFKVNSSDTKRNPEITVYNTFYKNKSWVRSDAKIASILVHEQGHFDLCEIYTRRLRAMMNNFDFHVPDVKGNLMAIFSKINDEYELRQQAYEAETIHGTNEEQQKKWLQIISNELN
jgi:hypothetical protein